MNRMASNLNSFIEQRMDMCVNINLHHEKAKQFAVGNGTLVQVGFFTVLSVSIIRKTILHDSILIDDHNLLRL